MFFAAAALGVDVRWGSGGEDGKGARARASTLALFDADVP